MSQIAASSDEQAGWAESLSITSQAASNLEEEYESMDALITAYREAEDITEVPQVGSATMRDLREAITERDPDAQRVRYENDEGVCTEYTTDHGVEDPEDDVFYFAFVCPRCESKNALKGDPRKFKNRPLGCRSCQWVSLLESGAVERFDEGLD